MLGVCVQGVGQVGRKSKGGGRGDTCVIGCYLADEARHAAERIGELVDLAEISTSLVGTTLSTTEEQSANLQQKLHLWSEAPGLGKP